MLLSASDTWSEETVVKRNLPGTHAALGIRNMERRDYRKKKNARTHAAVGIRNLERRDYREEYLPGAH